jgi:hypothetical protein
MNPVSLAQFGRILNALKGAMSLEFMAAGLVLAGLCLWKERHHFTMPIGKNAMVAAILLLLGGIVVYLPMNMIAGRYAMPAVWGLDILFAVLLTALITVPLTVWKKVAFACVCTGLAVVSIANIGRQEKFAARANMLWDAVHYVEATAPPNARIAWLSGDSLKGGLNIEEGIHFQWHLYHRGRGDVKIGLFDETGQPLSRVELPPLPGEPQFSLVGKIEDPHGWEPERTFASGYWLGRRRYDCRLSRKPGRLHAHLQREEVIRLLLEQGRGGAERLDPVHVPRVLELR